MTAYPHAASDPGPAGGAPATGEATRTAFVVALSVASGSLDAISFLGLGSVFVTVITGNLVIFGIGAGRGQGLPVLRAGVAIAAYGLGSAIGALVAGRPKEGQALWPRRVSAALALELCLLAVFTLGWELAAARPDRSAVIPLLAVAATAMGLQSVTVIRLDVQGLSSTYLTSTYIRAVTGLIHGPRSQALPRIGAVLAVVVGAVGGVLLFFHAPRFAPLIADADVAAVTALGVRLSGRGRALAQPEPPHASRSAD